MSQTLYRHVTLSKTTTLSPNTSLNVPVPVVRATSGVQRQVSAPSSDADGMVDISFRLYEEKADKLVPIDISSNPLARTFSQAILSGFTQPEDRDAELSKLLGHPIDGGLQRYKSVLVISPLSSTDESGPNYSTRSQGQPGTQGFRTFVQDRGADVSPWHDVALYNADGTLNFVCEIPKDTTAKFEVATAEASNPIKQDTKKGALRHYPYAIPWNYGMLPQTWEDPNERSPAFPHDGGDNDPVDVVEVGGVPLESGGVYPVKVLGAYAMIDCGELDWKLLCIRADHELAPALHDIDDVEREMPGELEAIMVWFRDYKIPDGKPANAFGYDSKPVGQPMAKAVIEDTHNAYSQLKEGVRMNVGNLSLQ